MKSIIPQDRILITGGGGFIASNLIRSLIPLNSNIHALIKNDTNTSRLADIQNKIKIHATDILDKNALLKLVKKIKPTIIYHLATHSEYRKQEEHWKMINVNIIGTMNLLEATKDTPYRLFVNTGSSSEYGFNNKAMKESDCLEPVSFYAATKASATHLCGVFAKEFQKPIITFRLFSVYGPFEEKTRLISTIIMNLLKGKPIQLTDGKIRRDFIFISDVVNAYILASQGLALKKIQGQIFNIGTGREYTNDEVVKTLFKVTGKKVKVEKGAYEKRLWDTTHWVANYDKAKKLFSWQPRFSLEKGLLMTYDWFLKHDSSLRGRSPEATDAAISF